MWRSITSSTIKGWRERSMPTWFESNGTGSINCRCPTTHLFLSDTMIFLLFISGYKGRGKSIGNQRSLFQEEVTLTLGNVCIIIEIWSRRSDLNRGPTEYESVFSSFYSTNCLLYLLLEISIRYLQLWEGERIGKIFALRNSSFFYPKRNKNVTIKTPYCGERQEKMSLFYD